MYLLLPDNLAKLCFDARQLATLRSLGECRGKQQLYVAQASKVLDDLWQAAVLKSTESSNLLKGVGVVAHRPKPLVLKNASQQSHSELEVTGDSYAPGHIHERSEQIQFYGDVRNILRSMKAEGLITPKGEGYATQLKLGSRHLKLFDKSPLPTRIHQVNSNEPNRTTVFQRS